MVKVIDKTPLGSRPIHVKFHSLYVVSQKWQSLARHFQSKSCGRPYKICRVTEGLWDQECIKLFRRIFTIFTIHCLHLGFSHYATTPYLQSKAFKDILLIWKSSQIVQILHQWFNLCKFNRNLVIKRKIISVFSNAWTTSSNIENSKAFRCKLCRITKRARVKVHSLRKLKTLNYPSLSLVNFIGTALFK